MFVQRLHAAGHLLLGRWSLQVIGDASTCHPAALLTTEAYQWPTSATGMLEHSPRHDSSTHIVDEDCCC